MAYKVIILYQLYMPSYFLGTFTEYPYKGNAVIFIQDITLPSTNGRMEWWLIIRVPLLSMRKSKRK